MSNDQFRKAEDQFFLLKGQLAAGRIMQQQFDAALKQLMIQDAQGRYWMIGADTGKWYVHDGQNWVEQNPSVIGAPAAPESYQAPSQSRGFNAMPWLAIAGIVVVCLIGALGLVLASSQGILTIGLGKPTATPFSTFAPVLPPIVPVVSTAPIVVPTATLPPTLTLAAIPSTATLTLTATPLPTPGSVLLLPPNITLKFDAGVTKDQQDIIQNGLAIAYQHLGDAGPVTVYAYSNLDNLMDEQNKLLSRASTSPQAIEDKRRFQNKIAYAMAYPGAMWIWVDDVWKKSKVATRMRLMTHEYFHDFQAYTSKKTSLDDAAPAWLKEASAEYLSFIVIAKYGLYDLPVIRKQNIEFTRGILNPLSTMETMVGANAEDYSTYYTLGYLAAEYMSQQYGEDALKVKYWQARATAPDWQTAFQAAFGVSPATFYQQFEDYRRAQFPPYCGTVGEAPVSTLSIKFDRQFAPGALPFTNYPDVSIGPNIPYIFCIKGTQFGLFNSDEAEKALVRPKESAGWVPCGGNCVILYMKPGAPTGTYTMTIALADGRRADTTFQHQATAAAAPAPPTATATSSPSPTVSLPTATATPTIAPGLYVTQLRMEPPTPRPGQEVGFDATFLNTASGTQNYRWLVYIYKADNLRSSFGETAAQATSIPVGSVEQKALGTWRVGIGTCGNFVARVAWLDENKKATPFGKPDGQVYELPFSTCP